MKRLFSGRDEETPCRGWDEDMLWWVRWRDCVVGEMKRRHVEGEMGQDPLWSLSLRLLHTHSPPWADSSSARGLKESHNLSTWRSCSVYWQYAQCVRSALQPAFHVRRSCVTKMASLAHSLSHSHLCSTQAFHEQPKNKLPTRASGWCGTQFASIGQTKANFKNLKSAMCSISLCFWSSIQSYKEHIYITHVTCSSMCPHYKMSLEMFILSGVTQIIFTNIQMAWLFRFLVLLHWEKRPKIWVAPERFFSLGVCSKKVSKVLTSTPETSDARFKEVILIGGGQGEKTGVP